MEDFSRQRFFNSPLKNIEIIQFFIFSDHGVHSYYCHLLFHVALVFNISYFQMHERKDVLLIAQDGRRRNRNVAQRNYYVRCDLIQSTRHISSVCSIPWTFLLETQNRRECTPLCRLVQRVSISQLKTNSSVSLLRTTISFSIYRHLLRVLRRRVLANFLSNLRNHHFVDNLLCYFSSCDGFTAVRTAT